MARSQYQPVRNQQLTDAQEVHYAEAFKKADIAAGFHRADDESEKNKNKK